MDYNNFNDQTFNTYSYITPPPVKPKRKKTKVNLPTIIISVLLSAVIGVTSSLVAFNYMKDKFVINNNVGEGNTITNISVDKTVEGVIEAVATKVRPSVVGIQTTAATNNFFGGSSEAVGSGSGIVYSADGYIITNYHVIESALNSRSSKIEVFLTSNTDTAYQASVVGYNISYDLAVIKIDVTGLQPIELGKSEEVSVGQFVAAVGSPGGLEFMGSVTYGIISGLDRVVPDSGVGSDVNLIQTDAAINPGNSGGALVNTKGKLIGVNSSKIAATEYEGMGFAIPVNSVVEICDKIIAKENDPDPYIGITISEKYTANILKQLGYPVGAVVKSVISGGPAYEAGIRSGDIIVAYNDKELSEYSDLNTFVSETSPNQKVNVKFYRAGKYYTTTVKVGSNNAQ